MNPQKIDAFFSEEGWGYVDVRATEKWWEEQRDSYRFYQAQIGKGNTSFYNPRVDADYARARRYMEHLRQGMQRISAGQPTDMSTAFLYWELAECSIAVLEYENEVLTGMFGSGLVTLLKILPTSKFTGALNRLTQQIPVLQAELKDLEKDAKEAGYQLLCSGLLTAVTNLLPPARMASVAVKALAAVAAPVIDNALGGDKSSEGMENLDAVLDYGVGPALVAIEGFDTKFKDSKTVAAARLQKAGKMAGSASPIADLMGIWCDLDEAWATKKRAANKQAQLRKAMADLRKTLVDLEDALAATLPYRIGAQAKLDEARVKMAESYDTAEELRDYIWELEAEWMVTEYDTPVWY
ncbi:MAG: hypothetical protein JNK87_25200 [Bryobacterales bacterium]|nr:hypothetical protein [Bryobacterales bacterium]